MMSSIYDCGCMSWLGMFFETIDDMCDDVDDIMTQNADVAAVKNRHNVQAVTENDRKLLAVAMRNVPLFGDDIKEAKLSDSPARASYSLEKAKKLLEENKQLRKQYGNSDKGCRQINESSKASSQKAQDDLKDSALSPVQHEDDMEWEVIDDFETKILKF